MGPMLLNGQQWCGRHLGMGGGGEGGARVQFESSLRLLGKQQQELWGGGDLRGQQDWSLGRLGLEPALYNRGMFSLVWFGEQSYV